MHPDLNHEASVLGEAALSGGTATGQSSLNTRLSTAPIELVEIASIRVGTRRRKARSSIDSLMRSISDRGLIHPVVVTRDRKLVVGQGRLEECDRLGWPAIPARQLDEITAEELRQIELAENLEREPLTAYEASVERLEEIRQAQDAAHREAANDAAGNFVATSPRKSRGRPPKPGSTRDLAKRTGISARQQKRDAERVAFAETHPVFKGAQWKEAQVLKAKGRLDAVPVAERAALESRLEGLAPRDALRLLTDHAGRDVDCQPEPEPLAGTAMVSRPKVLPREVVMYLDKAQRLIDRSAQASSGHPEETEIRALARQTGQLIVRLVEMRSDVTEPEAHA